VFVIALIGAFHAHQTRGAGPAGQQISSQNRLTVAAAADASNEFTGHHRDILKGQSEKE
jgi:hypothetical protein